MNFGAAPTPDCRVFASVQRVFTNFSLAMMKAQQVRVFTIDGTTLWIGTDNGLYTLNDADDSLLRFPQQGALHSLNITGVEVDPSYVYITTDKEVAQYNRLSIYSILHRRRQLDPKLTAYRHGARMAPSGP